MTPQRRAQLSWAMYDWANSSYATTVIAGFFPLFFNQYWAAGVAPTTATLYLGMGNSAASLVVMVLAPFLGTMADRLGAKKRFLLGFTLLGAAATAALRTEVGADPRPDEALAPPTRRAPARELSIGAASHREPRDRASFVPPTDSDWDTPAFQRRVH